jgi:hypothetical protein
LKTPFKIVAASLVILFLLFIWQGESFLILDNGNECWDVDAVIVLAGAPEDSLRVKKGVEITDSRGVQYLILPLRNSGITWSWLLDEYSIKTPISDERVLIGNMEPDDKQIFKHYGGTFLEAKKTIKIMLKHHLNSAIVVSSGYHMRRSRLAFEKAKEKYPIRFCYYPIREHLNKNKTWWLNLRYFQRVVTEYGKLASTYMILCL